MSLQADCEQLDDEVEEIRELLYNILKDYPAGITSSFLEQQYHEKYANKGIAVPLPSNWLSFVRVAEEFEVKDVSSGFTMLYLANRNLTIDPLEATKAERNGHARPSVEVELELHSPSRNNTNRGDDAGEDETLSDQLGTALMTPVEFNVTDFELIPVNSLPQPEENSILVTLLSALDPDNIYFRLASWHPYCDYLYSALSRLPRPRKEFPLKNGDVLAARVDGKWERVELVRPSFTDADHWVVYLIDVGYFHIVHRAEFKQLAEAVKAFNKIFLAKFVLNGIMPRSDSNTLMNDARNHWRPETQHFVGEALQKATMRNKCIELIPDIGGWKYEKGERIPTCTGKLTINGVDFADQLVSMGLAQKK